MLENDIIDNIRNLREKYYPIDSLIKNNQIDLCIAEQMHFNLNVIIEHIERNLKYLKDIEIAIKKAIEGNNAK